uniref:Alhambra n=1 Tax=Anopheles culicifacies TaxID=139723 RepID=A0A182M711_9DIPT
MSSTLTASSSSSSSLYGIAGGGGGGGGGGGLKFSYEAQPTNPLTAVSTASMIGNSGSSSVIAVPQVKDSPPSSPGSDAGGPSGTTIVSGRGTKRNRKMSSNAGPGAASTAASTGPTIVPASIVAGGAINDAKDGKLFQNGGTSAVGGGSVVSATHMLGNQLNPSSSVAQKMSDQLSMEIEAHSYVPGPIDAGPSLMGPQFPGKNRTNNAQPVMPVGGGGGNSLSSMLTGGGTATANGNTPQSLEQLLERQWEQGSQFLMEQAQHFDIASLLSCLHQLRSENIRLEEHVNNLVTRRDHLLAVNARLAIPLNPTAALGGVGIIGGSGGSGPGSGGGSVGGAGIGPTQGKPF